MKYLLLLLLSLLCIQCTSIKKIATLDFSSDPQTTIQVKTSLATNDGRPFYALVKESNESSFLTESYDSIADIVFEEDPLQLSREIIFPGQTITLKLKPKNKDKAIAVYFMFTSPGNHWKTILPTPLPKKYSIQLDNSQITSTGKA